MTDFPSHGVQAARERLTIDHSLVAEVEKWRTGQTAHKLAKVLTIYFCAPTCHINCADDLWKNRFEEAERQLRAFVAHARQDDFQATL